MIGISSESGSALKGARLLLAISGLFLLPSSASANPSLAPKVVIQWNNAVLQGVRDAKLGAPVVARALAIVHTCMYDAWAAYDDRAVGTTDINGTRRRPPGERTDANKAKAISFAAYRCLRNLYPDDGSSKVPPPSTGLGLSPSA